MTKKNIQKPQPPVRPRPFYELCRLLCLVNSNGTETDFAAAPIELLEDLAQTAELAMQMAQMGLRAAGEMVALSSPDTGASDWPPATLESIGWLIAELSDFAAVCHGLQATSVSCLPVEHRTRLTSPLIVTQRHLAPFR